MKHLRLQHQPLHRALVLSFINNYCLHTPWGVKAQGHLRSNDWKRLLGLSSELSDSLLFSEDEGWAGHSSSASVIGEYRLRSQFSALIEKYDYDEGVIPDVDPEQRALDLLAKDERRNKRLNTIFRAYRTRGTWRHPSHPHIADVMHRVLTENVPYNEIYALCDFSGGASLHTSGNTTHFGAKFETLGVTGGCVEHALNALCANQQIVTGFSAGAFPGDDLGSWLWARSNLRGRVKLVGYNKISCVPKKYSIKRTISKEPEGNLFVQKGVDQWLKKRLLDELNIDLTSQDVNQVMAREGSLGGADPYVTIDVKSASQGVFREMVPYLCPMEWSTFLNEIRSPSGEWPNGDIRRYEVFSTMGNGFTFPLESLIFSACCIAAYRLAGMKCDYRVYGDDIIVRQSVALLLIEILQSLGFRTNNDKTFVFGPFRESCGANWYTGRSVVPTYIRKRITSRADLHSVHNRLVCYPALQELLRSYDPSLPFVVPDSTDFDWVEDQAFRVAQDIWMHASGSLWRRDTRSWRFDLLSSLSRDDEDFGPAFSGQEYKGLRMYGHMRSLSARSPFQLRKSVRYVQTKAQPDSKLECSQARQYGRVSPFWSIAALQTSLLIRDAGVREPIRRFKLTDRLA